MMGFMYKDFLLMRKQLIYILVLVAVYAAMAVIGSLGPFILSAVVVILGLIYPTSAFAWDDQARWDRFAAATPAGRRGMVAARYLFSLLLILLSSALIEVLLLLLSLLGPLEEPAITLLLPVPACAAVALGINAVFLPLLYQFGAEKARVIIMIAAVLVGVGGAALGVRLFYGGFAVTGQGVLLAVLLLAGAAAALFAVSYRISLGIYGRKEF